MYSIKYQKFGEKEIFLLYFAIPEFYGCINSDKADVFGKKYLSICCGDVFNEFKHKLVRSEIKSMKLKKILQKLELVHQMLKKCPLVI